MSVPLQTSIEDADGNKLVVRLVRHERQICVLGVCFSFAARVEQPPVLPECAFCLEPCGASEWSCPTCYNLLHHACKKRIALAGMEQCPYCRC